MDIAKVLQLVVRTLDATVFEGIVHLIDELIIDDDEYLGTLEGLECAISQAILHSDIGQPRRTWFICRRALCLLNSWACIETDTIFDRT